MAVMVISYANISTSIGIAGMSSSSYFNSILCSKVSIICIAVPPCLVPLGR